MTLEKAYFLDGGYTYDGAATTTIDRLWHLEGMYVEALADGAVIERTLVQDGMITLPEAAEFVRVGLAYESKLKTMPWFGSRTEGGGISQPKNISHVGMLLKDTSMAEVGQTFDEMYRAPDRSVSLGYDAPPPLFTGLQLVPVGLGWQDGGQVCLRQRLPLPCTLLSVIPDAELGD